MKGIINKFMDWLARTFFTVYYAHSYNSGKLEYQVVSEVVTDKATIEKANVVLAEAA